MTRDIGSGGAPVGGETVRDRADAFVICCAIHKKSGSSM